MSIHIEAPPVLTGSSEEQLRMLHRYLYRMAEQLNGAVRELEAVNISTQEAKASAEDDRQELRKQLLESSARMRREIKYLKEKISDD